MASFSFAFRAPTLFDASAAVAEGEDLHGNPGAAEQLAKYKKLALWLKSRLIDKGMAAKGPILDESGWAVECPSNDEGTIICIVSCENAGKAVFSMCAFDLGGVSDDFGRIIEDILRSSGEIEELKAL
jgi:hypothetical protein